MKKKFVFLLPILLFAACEKNPDFSNADSDFSVFTNYDAAAKFNEYVTFYVPDSVLVIGEDVQADYWPADKSNLVVTSITNELKSNGYTQTSNKAEADLGIQVSYVRNVSYLFNYKEDSHWWKGYPGYWKPAYWGNWDDWSYSYPVNYKGETGAILIEIVDLTPKVLKDSNAKLRVLWTANAGGLLSGSDEKDMQSYVKAVQQAFQQSPYIHK